MKLDVDRVLRLAYIVLLATALSGPVLAAPLSLDVAVPDRFGPPGSYTFFGRVINESGFDLTESDLFLDFSGYDFGVVTPVQHLGDTPFLLPDGAISPLVDLFELTIGPSAAIGTTYFADVVVQDAFFDVSDTSTVTVTVTVPEPSSILLLLCAAVMAGLTRRMT